jgi:hypothetical protein
MRRLPWSISTTVRNPERLQEFLRVLAEFEGKQFDIEVQKQFQIRLIQERLYSPTKIPEELTDKYRDPMATLSFDEARRIFEHQGYKDPAMRGRQSANPPRSIGGHGHDHYCSTPLRAAVDWHREESCLLRSGMQTVRELTSHPDYGATICL